jgi:hypothetical protein
MFYVNARWFYQQYVVMVVKLIDVIHFNVNGFKLDTYCLMMSCLSCDVSDWKDYYIT